MKIRFFLLVIFLFALGVFVPHTTAFARLGETSSLSIKSSGYKKKFVAETSSSDKYTMTTVSENGLTVSEYLTNSGVVFAVKWQGEYQPDLQDIFGKYYSEYESEKEKNKNKSRGSRSHAVNTENLVVNISGHMRSMRGFAYAPSLIPRGVDIEQLK